MTHEEAALGCLGEFALFNPHSSPAQEVGSQMGIRYGLTCPGPELECPGVPAGLRWVGASAYQEPECSQRSIPELQHRGIHHWTPNRCGPGPQREGCGCGRTGGWVHPAVAPCSVQRGRLRQAYWEPRLLLCCLPTSFLQEDV